MITNRLYFFLFGLPLLVMPILGAVVSGGDLGFIKFFTGVAGGTVLVIAVISLPFVWSANAWQREPLATLARRVNGREVTTIGGDGHVRIDEPDGSATVIFWASWKEEAGDEDAPALPWTCVGRVRPGRKAPAVEVRLLPTGRKVRWANRWWDELKRRPPADPLATEEARAVADALAAIEPAVEKRLQFAGELVAFAVPGTRKDPDALVALLDAAREHVGRL